MTVTQGDIYSDLSRYYDLFCIDVDYREQATCAQRLFETFSSAGGMDHLDLACGTGRHMQHMQEAGFRITGLDNSTAMLMLASRRCPAAELLLCDLAALDHDAAFDLVTCFLYSIHYSYPHSALQQTLHGVRRALKPGGVFIFNAVDATGALIPRPVASRLTRGNESFFFESCWHYAGMGQELELSLSITHIDAGMEHSWRDRHVMSAVTLGELKAMLAEAGFSATLLEHDYTCIKPWDGRSHNVIVVACRDF